MSTEIAEHIRATAGTLAPWRDKSGALTVADDVDAAFAAFRQAPTGERLKALNGSWARAVREHARMMNGPEAA